MQRNRIYQICYIALLAALVFVSLNIQIEVPLGVDHTRFHLGNIMCLLAGFFQRYTDGRRQRYGYDAGDYRVYQ